jgi:hypothetical protein
MLGRLTSLRLQSAPTLASQAGPDASGVDVQVALNHSVTPLAVAPPEAGGGVRWPVPPFLEVDLHVGLSRRGFGGLSVLRPPADATSPFRPIVDIVGVTPRASGLSGPHSSNPVFSRGYDLQVVGVDARAVAAKVVKVHSRRSVVAFGPAVDSSIMPVTAIEPSRPVPTTGHGVNRPWRILAKTLVGKGLEPTGSGTVPSPTVTGIERDTAPSTNTRPNLLLSHTRKLPEAGAKSNKTLAFCRSCFSPRIAPEFPINEDDDEA